MATAQAALDPVSLTEKQPNPLAGARRRRSTYWLTCALLLILTLPARFSRLSDSVWLDEAWVANSLLEPSLNQTLFYNRWVQSTPPLFLAAQRLVARWFGVSEPVLRALPELFTFLGLAVLAAALYELFPVSFAVVGVATAASNYWIVKYGQQVKQFSGDFLVTAILFFLMSRLVRRPHSNWVPPVLLAAAIVGLTLSSTAMFLYPSCVIALLFGRRLQGRSWGASLTFACLNGSLLLAWALTMYGVFILPNSHPSLTEYWRDHFIDIAHPGSSILRIVQTIGSLMFPLPARFATAVGAGTSILLLVACLRAVGCLARSSSRRALVVLLAAVPFAAAGVASIAHKYPMLDYARLMVWAIPLHCTLLVYGVEWLTTNRRWMEVALPAASLTGAIVVCGLYAFVPYSHEDNRSAVTSIRSEYRDEDVVFVQPGMSEQFSYYSRLTNWSPRHLVFGKTGGPCCALFPAAWKPHVRQEDVSGEIVDVAMSAKGRTLWLLLPSGVNGHWSTQLAPALTSLPAKLASVGCKESGRQVYGYSMALRFFCAARAQ